MANPTKMAVVFISSGVLVDGGGFWIDAAGHIHRIPPWSPDLIAELTVGATMLNNAQRILDKGLSRQVETVGEEVIKDALPRLDGHLGVSGN